MTLDILDSYGLISYLQHVVHDKTPIIPDSSENFAFKVLLSIPQIWFNRGFCIRWVIYCHFNIIIPTKFK